jgi:ribonuclease HI
MRTAVGFRIRILVLLRQHQAALAVASETTYHKSFCQSARKVLFAGFDFSFPTTKNSFLTFHNDSNSAMASAQTGALCMVSDGRPASHVIFYWLTMPHIGLNHQRILTQAVELASLTRSLSYSHLYMNHSTEHPIASDEVVIYTDGAASPNPGKGGYGVVIIQNGCRHELSGGFRATTNNRMELMGAIVGLRAISSCEGNKEKVVLYSDAKYVVDMFNEGHALKWRKNGWTRSNGREKARNPDQWNELLTLAERHDVRMVWVKGHANNQENAHCDELAVAARQADDLPADEGFENSTTPTQHIASQQTLFDW